MHSQCSIQVSNGEAKRRGSFDEINKLSYLFNCINDDSRCLYSIDGFFVGNASRFINHSARATNFVSRN